MEPELFFPLAYSRDSFTTNVTSRQAGEADPVIRELLQNSLDAALRGAGREQAVVQFTIASRPLAELPGISAYRHAVEQAVQELGKQRTHDINNAVSRIERVLNQDQMAVLFCRDNGIGLKQNSIVALLSEGSSDKPNKGAGSYGLGHLTAYAASELRYVLYGGISDGTAITSGRAILASHRGSGQLRAGNGYWLRPPALAGFDLEHAEFPSQPPSLLQSELDHIDDSGTVVVVAGFNYFHDDERDQAVDDIRRVTALNFLGAVHESKMVVHIHDEISGRSETVSAATLTAALEPIKSQQRATNRGWLPGQQGWRALQTLQGGRVLPTDIDRSITVYFRELGANSSERSRVQIFRDGMWITNDVIELRTGQFNGVLPFDAVVMLSDADPDDHTEIYDLIRDAEGPEHRDLTKRRELQKPRKDKLRKVLNQLADALREAAGQRGNEDSFTPAGFAVFDGAIQRRTVEVPPVRHRQRQEVEGTSTESTNPTGTTAEETGQPDTPGQQSRKRNQRRAPSPGRAVPLRRSVLPQASEDGQVQWIDAWLDFGNDVTSSQRVGLRVYVDSGSDQTCEQPLAPAWCGIRSVQFGDTQFDGGGGAEVAIAAHSGKWRIELAETVRPESKIDVDIVRRQAAKADA